MIPGEQLSSDGGCEPCPQGTYRANGAGAACSPCPPGTTTPQSGAASADQCSLPVCRPGELSIWYRDIRNQPRLGCHSTLCDVSGNNKHSILISGSYLNVTLNTCIQCRKGTYQSEGQQTVCVPCPINTSTRGPGAVSKSREQHY